MSHHFDSPTAIEDGRLNLCDLYALAEPSDRSTVILTINPDAGRSSPTTFRRDALYEFVIAPDTGTVEDQAFRLLFTDPDPDGRQQMQVLYADGAISRDAVDGLPLGCGMTDEIFSLDGGGVAWFGSAADPFWADGLALFEFIAAIEAGDYQPELFGAEPGNIFAGRNVTAIALQLPNSSFHGPALRLWGRISLYGHDRELRRVGPRERRGTGD